MALGKRCCRTISEPSINRTDNSNFRPSIPSASKKDKFETLTHQLSYQWRKCPEKSLKGRKGALEAEAASDTSSLRSTRIHQQPKESVANW